MTSVAILQARTNSSRLPGKVLLHVAGMPLVVLAARRAANTGRNVVVATSCEPTDDALAATLVRYDIPVYRGSLENTLQRFVDALAPYDNCTRVIRLTADNVLPDGKFLDLLEQEFMEKGLYYLSSTGVESGLPYGVSAEIMYLGDLREAAIQTESNFDREHVTPWVRRKYGNQIFLKYENMGMEHYRATVDCFDDYISIQSVFEKVEDPVKESLGNLVNHLVDAPYQPVVNAPASKLVLGVAQLGMNYGINNRSGKPTQSSATELVKMAIVNGIPAIDTARAYGDSEKTIGDALRQGWQGRVKVITKLSPLQHCPTEPSAPTAQAFVEASVYESCTALNMQVLDVLLIHRASHRTAWGGEVWKHLLSLRDRGVIGALGASVQNPEELESCLEDPDISYIQMPFNILDHRWDKLIPDIDTMRQERGLVVHTRSALLQGLLTATDPALWKRAGVAESGNITDWLDAVRVDCGYESIAELCLAYCFTQDWIDGVVVGVETKEQLLENLAIADSVQSTRDWRNIVSQRPFVDEAVLNPATWQ